MRAAVVGGLLMTVVLSGGTAWGQTSSDAEYAHASELRSGQHFAEALAIYQRLAGLTHEPRAIAQVGVTEAQMGRWVAGEEHLTAALATSDRWVRHHRDVLQAALDQVRQHIGNLNVSSNVSGAELRVNDTSVGRLPRAPVRVALGAVVVDLVADGYEPHRETVQVTGQSTQLELTLVRRATTASASIAPIDPTPTPTPTPTSPARVGIVVRGEHPDEARPAVEVDTPAVRGDPASTLPRTLAWASVAAGAAFLGLGVGTYLVGDSAAARWNSAQCLPPGILRETACPDERSTAETMGVLATVGFVGAGLLGATSVVLFVTARSPRDERPTARGLVGCGPGPGQLGLSCGGRF